MVAAVVGALSTGDFTRSAGSATVSAVGAAGGSTASQAVSSVDQTVFVGSNSHYSRRVVTSIVATSDDNLVNLYGTAVSSVFHVALAPEVETPSGNANARGRVSLRRVHHETNPPPLTPLPRPQSTRSGYFLSRILFLVVRDLCLDCERPIYSRIYVYPNHRRRHRPVA